MEKLLKKFLRMLKYSYVENQTQLPALKPEIETNHISVPIRQRFQNIMEGKKD